MDSIIHTSLRVMSEREKDNLLDESSLLFIPYRIELLREGRIIESERIDSGLLNSLINSILIIPNGSDRPR